MEFRNATMEDAALLFSWRTDSLTVAASVSKDEIVWEGHVAWLERRLQKPGLLIAVEDGCTVGVVRIDNGEEVELSWTVAPEMRGRGVGKRMVAAAARPGMVCRIKSNNIASQNVARYAGFVLENDGDLQKWRLPLMQGE